MGNLQSVERPAVGRMLGRWTLRHRLGAGSFGETWRATRDDGAVAALKVVRTPPGAELRTLAQLTHPAIPALLDAGHQAPWYLAVELAPGVPLSSVLASDPIDEADWLRGMGGLFDALALVHAASLKHGDVSPDNILWCPADPIAARLVDFGLSETNGGTPLWMAPEQLGGGGAGPESDVYSLALVTWAGLFGGLPHSDLEPDEALSHRCLGAPELPADGGPDWLRELLVRTLSPDPASRPTAAAISDVFEAHGVVSDCTDASVLRRRAATVRIRRRTVDGAISQWHQRGGKLVLVGPPGSGRKLLADQVCLDLASTGQTFVRFEPVSGPWGAVVDVLAALGAMLPDAPDDATRVDRVVGRLRATAGVFVVHGYSELDVWSQRVVDQLVAEGHTVLVTATERPPWAVTALALGPLDGDQIGALLSALLGRASDCPATRRSVWRATRGLAGDVARFVVASVEQGALVRRRGAWIFDESVSVSLPERRSEEAALLRESEDGAVAAAYAWLGCPVPPEEVATLLGRSVVDLERSLARLSARGQVRMLGDEAMMGRELVCRLRDPRQPPPFEPSAGLALVEALHPHALEAQGWLAMATGDQARMERAGLRALRWWTRRAPTRVLALGGFLAERCPTGAVIAAQMELLVAAGRVSQARELGLATLGVASDDVHRPGMAGVMRLMAELENHHGGRPESALEWCARARRATRGPIPSELVLVEARSHFLLGDYPRACEGSRPLAQAPMPESEEALRLWLRARTLCAESLHHRGEHAGALELLETIPEDVGYGMAERAMAHAALGRLYWHSGQIHAADQAMTLAGADGAGLGMLQRAQLLNNLGAVRHHSGNRAEAVSAWEQALVLFERVQAELEAERTRANLCVGFKELGRFERARQVGLEAARGAARLRSSDLICHAALNLGELDLCEGRYAHAEARFQEALVEADAAGLVRDSVEARLRSVELSLRRGDGGVAPRARAVEAVADEAGLMVERCQASVLRAAALARQGAPPDQVDPLVDAAIRPLQEAGAASVLAWARLWVAEAWLALDRPRDAAIEVDKARAFARERSNVPLLQQADELEDRLSTRWSDPERDGRIEQLVSVAVAINEQADLRDVFNRIAQASRELLDGDRAFVLTGDPPEVVAAVARGALLGPPSMSVVEKAMRQQREVIAADVGERRDLREVRSVAAMELRSVMCVPMRHHDEVIGAIYVDSRTASQQRMWESAELMRGLSALAAVAVVKMRYFEETVRQATMAAQLAERERVARELEAKNAELERLNQQLQVSAITDPLTGIGNRRQMATVLSVAFRSAQQGGEALSVIIADIDHFKNINDTRGHQAGDFVIAEVARRVGSCLRGEDRVFRYGGEELVVLTHALDEAALGVLCERIRTAIADDSLELGGGRAVRVTVSLGASFMLPNEDTRWEDILQRADAALYQAKEGGRNRVVLHRGAAEATADPA